MLQVSPGAILSLIVTIFVGVMFFMMVSETLALARGRDPVTNLVRSLVRALPPHRLRGGGGHRYAARPSVLALAVSLASFGTS